MTTTLAELPLRPLSGQESLRGTAPPVRLTDFWQWSMSALMENTTRGPLAEFLVAAALGVLDQPQKNWENWDLELRLNGRCIKIEVKSKAERQSWKCRPSVSHTFNISKTEDSWGAESGKRRWSDIYVFCILRNRDATEQSEALDTASWTFLILPTATLPDQQSISLNQLRQLHPVETDYAGLKDGIETIAASLA